MWRRYLRLLGSDPSADVEDELAFHLESRVEDLVRAGLTESEARSRAEREFGDVERIRGEMNEIGRARQRRERRTGGLESLRQDARFAVRTLARTPGFSAVAILTLALGIGASTGMFMLVNTVLLSPLPYADAERLVMVWERPPQQPTFDNGPSPANYVAWREQATSFTTLASFFDRQAALTDRGEPEEVSARFAATAWFGMLGVPAALGRAFGEEDRGERLAVLSHRLWQRRYAGEASIVGGTITFNQQPVTVVGVMPRDFRPVGGSSPDVWVPFDPPADGRGRYLRVAGRLAPGVSLERARAEMRGIAERLQSESVYNEGWSADVVPLREQETGDVRPALLVLLGAVGLLLLIACGNLASLLLGRAAARTREMAVRLSLGASRGRLLRQTLTEALVLAAAGGVVGVALATAGLDVVIALVPSELALPRLGEVGLDGRVLAFAAGVSMLTAALFGMAPALAASGTGLATALRAGSRGTTGGHGGVRRALVVAQVALAVVLLGGAGLLARSLDHLIDTDLGMRTERVLTFRLWMSGYRSGEALNGFVGEVMPRLGALPGVAAAGGIDELPLTPDRSSTGYAVEGRPPLPPGDGPSAGIRRVAGDYFGALGIPLVRGRTFDARDHGAAPRAYVVSQALAEEVFPGEDPLGKRLVIPWGEDLVGEIVGVVGDVREDGPDREARPVIYWAFAQMPGGVLNVVLRTPGDPLALAGPAAGVIRELDPQQTLGDIRPMEQVARATTARPRFYTTLLGGFATFSLLLAGLGLFGVISYSVAQRRRAIGVRIALGASPESVTRLVVREGMALTGVGLVLGIAVAAAVTRLLGGMLHGVTPTDPLTAAAVCGFLGAIALLASWIPARRAARVDPTEAMRPE